MSKAGVKYLIINTSKHWRVSGQVPGYKYIQALEGIDITITDDINHALTTFPMDKEIKSNLMTMDLDCVPRPDGFRNNFF